MKKLTIYKIMELIIRGFAIMMLYSSFRDNWIPLLGFFLLMEFGHNLDKHTKGI